MFNEITGNTDLYAQEVCECRLYCGSGCSSGCTLEYPRAAVRIEELAMVYSELNADQN
ncbi:MAG: hypothetical protein PVH88_18140 [Ignavibacteria bacterium]|jgi:hypothetical protein